MLISLELKNWRSHSHTMLEFRKGTNLLIGIMGSGKSSILDAICFALFGTFPAIERRKASLEETIRLNEQDASVKAELGWNGARYIITREIRKKRNGGADTDAEIYKDGKLLERGTTPVTSYVCQLFSISFDLFSRAVYSEQNNIDYFLAVEPKKRKAEMDNLLGLDKFEDARANSVTLLNRVKAEREIVAKNIGSFGIGELEKKEKELAEKVGETGKKLNETDGEISKATEDVKITETNYMELAKKREQISELTKEKSKLEGYIATWAKELEGKEISEEKIAEMKRKREDAEARKMKATQDLKAIDTNLSGFSKNAGILDTRIKSSEKRTMESKVAEEKLTALLDGKQHGAINAEIKGMEEGIIALESEKKSAESEIANAEKSTSHLAPGMEECPVCGSKLEEKKAEHIINERRARIAELKNRISGASIRIIESRKKLSQLVTLGKDIDALMQRIIVLRGQHEDIEALVAERNTLMAGMAAETEKKNAIVVVLENTAQETSQLAIQINNLVNLLKMKKESEGANIRLAQLSGMISEIGFDERKFEEIRNKVTETKVALERINGIRTTLIAESKATSETLEATRKELAVIKKSQEEERRLGQIEEELAIFKNSLMETQVALRSELIEAINSAMSGTWRIIYPYADIIAVRITATDKDYLFEIQDGSGTWKPLDGIASGGERACVALALRIALSMVLTPNLGMLILDEPTHNLDKEAVELLSQTLQLKVPEVIGQTIVITHEEGLMGSEFAASYKLTRQKEGFGATVTERI